MPMKEILNKKQIGLCIGVVLFSLFFLPKPTGLSKEAFFVAIIGMIMAVFWMTEPIPISITAIFPLVFFPILGVAELGVAAKGFSNPILFLFIGGFFLAIAMEKWNLHKRFAFYILYMIGSKPDQLIFGFFVATGFLSMWVNNTSTAMMFLPIAMSVIQIIEENNFLDRESEKNFSINIFLSIAYASSIGGICTLIGTTPNVFMASFVKENLNLQIQFLDWFKLGLPLYLLSIFIVPFVLLKTFPIKESQKGLAKTYFKKQIQELGKLSRAEVLTFFIFLGMVTCWLSQPFLIKFFPFLSDAVIGIAGGLLTFLIPVQWRSTKFLLEFEDVKKLPWDALLLFGGGLSLAYQIEQTKLGEWIGNSLSFIWIFPAPFIMLFIIILIMSLTQLTSNVATTAAFLPIVASFAKTQNLSPLYLIIPATISASCAFILPVATPPNTIVYATGKVPMEAMIKAGFRVNLIYVVLVFWICQTLL